MGLTLAEHEKEFATLPNPIQGLVEHYLGKIAKSKLNAFVEVYGDEARVAAQSVDKKVAEGTAGKLAGMVIGVKDNIVVKGHMASAGSKILKGFESLFTATALERLLAEDAIIIGRLNCDEFAMGSSNENSAYGPVLNPVDETRVPGGSSGGSAAAVKAGLCRAALGSDTGGSVRQPAAFTGIIGLKPTYGRISRYGLIAYGSSFDQIGTLTHSVADAALLLGVMAGADVLDNTSASQPVEDYRPNTEKGKYRIAVLNESLNTEGLAPEVKSAFLALIGKLEAEGHEVTRVDFPYLEYVVPTYYILTTAEASSNLSRYDGVRFGYRAEGVSTMEELYRRSRSEGFGQEVQRRIVLGTFVLSSGYYDAYYTKAQKVRRLIHDYTRKLLQEYDFLLSPTTPTTAFKLGEKNTDPISMYLSDIFTVHANLAGCPGISLPLAESPEGLPIGFHLLADLFQEQKLLQFSELLTGSALFTV